MSLNDIREFNNNEELRVIREKVLNPLSTYVKSTLTPDVDKAKEDIKATYKDVTFDPNKKEFTFSKFDTTASPVKISIAGVIPEEFEGLRLSDGKGGTVSKVKSIVIDNASLQNSGDDTHLDFDWGHLVPLHQEYPKVKIGTAAAKPITKITFSGNEGKVSISGDTLDFAIPSDPIEFKASIKDSSTGTPTETAITKILIEGNTTGSEITSDGELKLNIPTGGAGGTGGNFQGFFDNEGELVSSVQNPVNGKSFAFVKDDILKDKYYTPYMYVNNGWTEAPTDPSLTFEPELSSGPQGVFSIKPDTRIKLNPQGQLDLSLLGEGHFVGFFDNQDELNLACPNPLVDKSFAYIKTPVTEVYSGVRYTLKKDGTKAWVSVTPYGLISAVTKDGDGTVKAAQPVFGIENNAAITVDSGVITIKEPEEQSIKIIANEYPSGVAKEAQVTEVNFVDGVYVEFTDNDKTALIRHPHRVIHYGPDFEHKHESATFLGNIFFDANTNAWMGYTVPPLSGDKKWTYIAHRGMSDEVKGLSYRYPVKAPTTLPGQQSQDHVHWGHNGFAYVENATDVGFDSSYNNQGIYITTIVQDTPNDDPLRPKKRIQVAYTDEIDSATFIRISNPNAGAQDSPWRGWSKVSLSQADIDIHNQDPEAHKNENRFYKVVTTNLTYKSLLAANGNIYDKDGSTMPVADNRGLAAKPNGMFQVPYPGRFRLSGRIEIDNAAASSSSGIWYKGTWTLRVNRIREGKTEILQSFIYEQAAQSVKYPGMSWKGTYELLPTDEIFFNLTFLGDGKIEERAEYANFIPWRTYFVLEDSVTNAGSRIAETFRKTVGMFYSYLGTGVNAHPTNLDSPNSVPRVYGSNVDMNTQVMAST